MHNNLFLIQNPDFGKNESKIKALCVLVDELFLYSIVQAVALDTVLNVTLLYWLRLYWMLLLLTNTT